MKHCIFCQIIKGDAPSWKVYENDLAYAFLDINPVNAYHTLVIPKNHCTNMFDVSEQDLMGVMRALKHVLDLYHTRLGLEHAQVVCSSGEEAQQDVFHLHYHIVPRHRGDGQNIRWKTHSEMREQFDEMLHQLQV